MTELTTYEAPLPSVQTVVNDVQDRAVQRLTDWARSADAAYQIAEKLVQSSFVPQSFRGKPVEATAAILAGLEIGLQPMAALRSFDVIQGVAAPRAITLRAVVQSYGHQMELVESTNTRCKMRGRRRGESNWQPVTWTLDRAKDLGLTGKDNWKKQPGAMLVARATSELARLIAADAILGLGGGYSAEEVADGETPAQEAAEQTVDATPAKRRTMSRKKAEPKQEPEPVAPEPVDDDEPDRITKAQMKMLHASFNDAGVTERPARLDYCNKIIGREVETSNDLTKDEASRVIDALVQDAKAEPAAEQAEPPEETW